MKLLVVFMRMMGAIMIALSSLYYGEGVLSLGLWIVLFSLGYIIILFAFAVYKKTI